MISFSLLHWFLLLQVLLFLPFFWVLKKMGRSQLWGILALVPLVNIALFWTAAFWKWPALDRLTEDPATFD